MLLGRHTLHLLQNELIALRITLSDTITSIYALREKIRADAAELFVLPEKAFFSPEDIKQIESINKEAQAKTGCDKINELAAVFEQADTLSATIFADGIKGLQTELLDEMRTLLIQAIKDMLNAFYFSKVGQPAVSQLLEAFLIRNPSLSSLIHATQISYKSETNRTELVFSDALDQMAFPQLIQRANEVMWAVEKTGVKNCHLILVELHNQSVVDRKFGDYLRCERWIMTGGYYWLTLVPQTKNFVENELASQETDNKFYNDMIELKKLADEKMAVAKSNLNVDIALERRITALKVKLIKEARATATVYEHQKKIFKIQPAISDAHVPDDDKPDSALPENDHASESLAESKKMPLIDQLFELLQAALMDAAIENKWGKPVWLAFWNLYTIQVRGVCYLVPRGIYQARMALNKLEEEKPSPTKTDIVQKICAHLRDEGKDQIAFYGAATQFLEGENLVIDEEKIAALRQIIKKEMSIHLQGNLDFNVRVLSPR